MHKWTDLGKAVENAALTGASAVAALFGADAAAKTVFWAVPAIFGARVAVYSCRIDISYLKNRPLKSSKFQVACSINFFAMEVDGCLSVSVELTEDICISNTTSLRLFFLQSYSFIFHLSFGCVSTLQLKLNVILPATDASAPLVRFLSPMRYGFLTYDSIEINRFSALSWSLLLLSCRVFSLAYYCPKYLSARSLAEVREAYCWS